jgi:ParB family chromosome partitioning protein
MRLLQLPDVVRDGLRAGSLSAGHARALLGHPDPAAAAKIVITRGLNVRQTEALVQKGAAPAPERKVRDAETVALERELSALLGLKVQITQEGRGGSLKVSYRNLDQLDGLLALLRRS